MQFRFNPKKAAQAAAYLLHLRGGREQGLKLIKLLFMADRQALVGHGAPITGDTMLSMRHGPVLSEVLYLINGESEFLDAWSSSVARHGEYGLKLAHEFDEGADTDELSRYELRVLREVHQNYGNVDTWKLVGWLHANIPEWRETDSVLPLPYEDVLRANKVSEQQIAHVAKDAELHMAMTGLGR